MNEKNIFQKPLHLLRQFTIKQKIGFFSLLIFIICLIGLFIFVSSRQQEESSLKTWKVIVSYNTTSGKLSLKQLSLLDQTIRPDYRLSKFSAYTAVMLGSNNKVIFSQKVPIIDDIEVDTFGLPSHYQTSPSYDSLLFLPYKSDAVKLQIVLPTKAVALEVPLPQAHTLNIVHQSFAQTNGIRTDTLTCGKLQVVFVNDNYTDIGKFKSDVASYERMYVASPYNANMFDFQEIDQPQNYNCTQGGLYVCVKTNMLNLMNTVAGQFPNAGGGIVLTNNTTGARPVDNIAGISALGTGIAFFTNYTYPNAPAQEVPVHEFEGHAIGWLRDTYILSGANYDSDPNGVNSLDSVVNPNVPRSNCSTNPNGESWWKTADPNSGVYQGCGNRKYYAPYPATCPGGTLSIGNFGYPISGGNPISLMSTIGCSNGASFSPVESYWIQHNIVPLFSACPTATPTSTSTPTSTPTLTATPTPSISASPTPTLSVSSQTTSGSYIKAVVFTDTNNNFTQDSNESGISAATVSLVDSNGHSSVQTTDSNGVAFFQNVAAGNYKISFVANLSSFTLKASTSFTMTPTDVATTINFPVQAAGVNNTNTSISVTPTSATNAPSGSNTPTPTYNCVPDVQCETGNNSVQLCTLKCVEPTTQTVKPPTPGGTNYCAADTVVTNGCTCPDITINCATRTCTPPPGSPGFFSVIDTVVGDKKPGAWCALFAPGLCTDSNSVHCVAKPVIYLYPTKDTLVNVKLDIPGIVTISIPSYPTSGWQNVLAHPDGSLNYQDKTYHELYYETQVKKYLAPSSTGILISTKNLEKELKIITGKLGLTSSEQQEFVDYWLPKLENLHSNYIFISLLSKEQKDSVDKVTISPKPDTFIEYLFTFKPVAAPFVFDPLQLPSTPPQRKGFTAVEWGGSIENNGGVPFYLQ